MTNLTRKKQNIFCNNNQNDLSVFGSRKQGQPTQSADVETLQSENYNQGWEGAVIANNCPTMEDFNTLNYINTYQLSYLFQKGIAEWNKDTTYYKGNICMVIVEDKPILYYSKIDSNINNNPQNDIINWEQLQLGGNGGGLPLFTIIPSDHLLNDVNYLRSDTFSWQSGNVYTSAYNTLVNEKNSASQTTTETIGGVSITYYKSTNGFNIVDPTQEQNIINLYNNTGIAWFYILDETNKQFKLPRTKYNFVGYRNNVGGYVEESLPNITGSVKYKGLGGVDGENGALYNTSGGGYNHESSTMTQGNTINFDASLSSSTYQDNAPVQQRATEMYLYFYVGNTVRNETEIDVGAITEELNNKVNVSNVKNICIGYPDYSAEVELVFEEENTIPENGWLEVSGLAFYGVNVDISINGVLKTLATSSNQQYSCTAWVIIPVSAGDIVQGLNAYQDGKFIFYPNK